MLDQIKSTKFRKKSWIETNDQSRGEYNTNSDIRFKTTMLKSSLFDYSVTYILVKIRITITRVGNRRADERNKGVIFKNCAPFINCKSEINNTEIDNTGGIDTVMPMYNLIKYSNNYWKTFGSLSQYYGDEPNDNLTDSESFKSIIKITGNTPADGNTKDVEIVADIYHLTYTIYHLIVDT